MQIYIFVASQFTCIKNSQVYCFVTNVFIEVYYNKKVCLFLKFNQLAVNQGSACIFSKWPTLVKKRFDVGINRALFRYTAIICKYKHYIFTKVKHSKYF